MAGLRRFHWTLSRAQVIFPEAHDSPALSFSGLMRWRYGDRLVSPGKPRAVLNIWVILDEYMERSFG